MMDRLAVGRTLGHRAFAATTADANPVYDVTLLGLVAQPPRFVGSGGAGSPVQRGQLAVLPATDPQQEAHHVRLLLPPELLDILVRAHLGSPSGGGEAHHKDDGGQEGGDQNRSVHGERERLGASGGTEEPGLGTRSSPPASFAPARPPLGPDPARILPPSRLPQASRTAATPRPLHPAS